VPPSEGASQHAGQGVRGLAGRLEPYHRKYEAARDTRAIFAYAYYNISLDLAEELEDQRRAFDDPEWIASLAIAFGSRFLSAMDAIDTWVSANPGVMPTAKALYGSVPRPWADVYLAICGDQSYVLEDLAYSMMAHISFDLPNALLNIPHDVDRLGDYHRMNDVLASQTNHIQASVARRYQRFLFVLDRLTGTFDEFLTNYGIRVTRSMAFYNALRLSSVSGRNDAAGSIDRSSGLFIESVRHPDLWWLRWLVRIARWIIPRRRRWPAPGKESIRWESPASRGRVPSASSAGANPR
jgi:hypothetical protein